MSAPFKVKPLTCAELLSAETSLQRLTLKMAAEFQNNGRQWPRQWMVKNARDRGFLLEARKLLLSEAERIAAETGEKMEELL